MKIISGKVVSSKPMSLSKAEKVITGFADTDNGASDALCEYVRRTAVAFQNLVKFHKELKTPTSHREENASQPVKAETLADTDEILEEKKVQKRKKNRGLEANQSQSVTVSIEGRKYQNGLDNEVAEIPEEKKVQKRKKNHGLEASQSQSVGKKDQEVMDQGANESSGKKGKKKDKKERIQNEEGLMLLQTSDVKVEKIEYEDASKEFDGSVVKTGKKKRKRDEDDVGQKSLEEDVKTENIWEAGSDGKREFDGSVVKTGKKKRNRDEDDVGQKSLEEDVKTENIGEADSDGKPDGRKKRKKMKAERTD